MRKWAFLLLVSAMVLYAVSIWVPLEGFSNDVDVRFLSKAETENFFAADSDGYFERLSLYDLAARGFNNHNAYWQRSIDSAIEPDASLKERVLKSIHKIMPFLKTLNLFGVTYDPEIKWTLAFTDGKIYEQGLPHTREHIIFLTPETVSPDILLHEWIHLYQRKHKTQVQSYLKQQGYNPWRLRAGYPRIRANPDLDEYIYMHPNKEWMLYVYDENPKNINDILRAPIGHRHEHPYEEAAYEIVEAYKK